MTEIHIDGDDETIGLYERYMAAQHAKSSWAAEEKMLKAQLLKRLAYKPGDEQPTSGVVSHNDRPVFQVQVGTRMALDSKALRDKRPDVYAEFERCTHPIRIRPVSE